MIILLSLGAAALGAIGWIILRAAHYRRRHPEDTLWPHSPGLLLALLLLSNGTMAQDFTVTNSGSTFTITRSGGSLPAQSVLYRTVSLSAIAGQHFTAASGTLTFAADETSKTVTVTESTPGTDAYKYQTSSGRTYRFEVTDLGGYILASKDRSITSGLTQFSGTKVSSSVSNLVTMSSGNFSSGMSSSKYLDVSYTPHPSGDSLDVGQGALVHTATGETLTFYRDTRSTNSVAKGSLPPLPKGLCLGGDCDQNTQDAHSAHFAHVTGDQLIIQGEGTLTAYDIMGRELFRCEASSDLRLPTSAFPQAGVYILRMGVNSQKIVIK